MSDGQSVVEVSHLSVGLTKAEGSPSVVHDVSFSVAEGERFGLVGPSGSGKSTIARALVDLLPEGLYRRTGTIKYRGRDLTNTGDWLDVRGRGIATIPQNPMRCLVPVVTVGQQAAAVCRAHTGCDASSARSATNEMFARVHLPDPERTSRSYPHELSGGMAQRVTIAMALLGRPRLLIADEPTTGLDVVLQARVLELLSTLIESEGTSLMLISHDLGVIASLTTRLAVIQAGTIVEHGPTQSVLRRPQHEYTRALLAAGALANPHD